jgi:hypothetical protein
MVMMTSFTQAEGGSRGIPDRGNAECSLMPESSNDQCRLPGNNNSPARRESQIEFITGEMNGY